jgi:hypothetical protein
MCKWCDGTGIVTIPAMAPGIDWDQDAPCQRCELGQAFGLTDRVLAGVEDEGSDVTFGVPQSWKRDMRRYLEHKPMYDSERRIYQALHRLPLIEIGPWISLV